MPDVFCYCRKILKINEAQLVINIEENHAALVDFDFSDLFLPARKLDKPFWIISFIAAVLQEIV